jgi:methionine-rich copper-binding protein CopC
MKKIKTVAMKPYVILVFCICMFVFISSFRLNAINLSPNAASQEASSSQIRRLKLGDIKITNKTSSLTVLDIEQDGEQIKVKLQNDSNKSITAYDVAVGIGSVGTECLTGDDENNIFLPGGIREEIYSIQKGMAERGIVILSAFFEDGSAEGDPQSIQYTKEYRSGMKTHREYVLAFLRGVLNSPTLQTSKTLTDLESMPSPLSDEQLNALPPNFKLGFNAERTQFLHTISSLKNMAEQSNVTQSQGTDNQKQTDIRIKIQNGLSILFERYSRTSKKL